MTSLTPAQRSLWTQIENFAFDPPATDSTFIKRLAREQSWSEAFALGALAEYRRFVLLMVVCEHPVTPSREVDEVWHLHLTHTVSYWHGLCRDTLGRELHHHPTRGGPLEDARFLEQYQSTLEQYREVFGEEPPPAYWPDPVARFAPRVSPAPARQPRLRLRGSVHLKLLVFAGALLCGLLVWWATGQVLYGVLGFLGGGYVADRALHLSPSTRQAHGGGSDSGITVGWIGDSSDSDSNGGSDGGSDGGGGGCGGGCGS